MSQVITTLMQATLTLASIEYIFPLKQEYPNQFTLKLTTSSLHKIRGIVKATLVNAFNFTVNGEVNYFNNNVLWFKETSNNTLEATINWNDFNKQTQIKPTVQYTVFPNSGSAISLNVDNTIYNKNITTGKFTVNVDSLSDLSGTEPNGYAYFSVQQYSLDDLNFITTVGDTADKIISSTYSVIDEKADVCLSSILPQTRMYIKVINN